MESTPPTVYGLRLGYTETTLFFYYWLDKVKHIKQNDFLRLDVTRDNLINWLYSTSGFYDKQIAGTYFNFNESQCIMSPIYNLYMANMFERVKDSQLTLCFHKIPDDYLMYKNDFIEYIKTIARTYSHEYMPNPEILQSIKGKRLLIVNPMGSLMKQQYDNGNINKVQSDFPTLQSVEYIENPYTFLNSGPDKNIIDTANKITKMISEKEFDIAIVSCGAYSSILAYYIHKTLGKDVITMGGELLTFFGIKTKRDTWSKHNEYWVSVPDHLKPANYMKIEDGCYW